MILLVLLYHSTIVHSSAVYISCWVFFVRSPNSFTLNQANKSFLGNEGKSNVSCQLLLQWLVFSKSYIKYMELHYHYEVTIKLFYIMLLLILVLRTSVGHAFWKP